MAEQGFQRDVTTQIKIPQVQAPDFTQNRTGVEDLADVASFGLQVFDRVSAGNRETKRLERLATADNNVNSLINEYSSILDQGGSLQKANSNFQKRVAQMENSGYIRDQVIKGLKPTREDFRSSQAGKNKPEFPEDFIDDPANDAIFRDVKLGNKWDTTAPQGTELREKQNAALRDKLNLINHNANQQQDLAIKKDKTAVDRKEIVSLHYEQYGLANATMLNEMGEMLEEAKLSPIGDQKAILANIDTITTNMEQAFVQQGLAKLGPDATAQEIKTLETNAASFFGLQRNATQEYRDASTRALELFTNDHNINAWEAGNILTQLKLVAGEGAAGIGLIEYISRQSLPDEAIADVVGRAYGLTKTQQAGLDKQRLTNYLAGGGTMPDIDDLPYREGEKEALFKQGFDYYKELTVKGDLGSMEGVDATVASNGLVNVLADHNSQDPETSGQILSIVSDPDMGIFLERVGKEGEEGKKQADGLRNMIITTSKDSLRSNGGSLSKLNSKPQNVFFDSRKGSFALHPDFLQGEGALPATKNVRQKEVDSANKAVKTFLRDRKGNPALADMTETEALHWLLKGGSGSVALSKDVKVVGGDLVAPTASEEQILRQQSNQEWQDRIKRETDLVTASETLKQKSFDIKKAGVPKAAEPKSETEGMSPAQITELRRLQLKEAEDAEKAQQFADRNMDKV